MTYHTNLYWWWLKHFKFLLENPGELQMISNEFLYVLNFHSALFHALLFKLIMFGLSIRKENEINSNFNRVPVSTKLPCNHMRLSRISIQFVMIYIKLISQYVEFSYPTRGWSSNTMLTRLFRISYTIGVIMTMMR